MSTRVPEPLGPGEYARQVRRALVDLSSTLDKDLLEDLDEHLAEVAAEGDGPLEARLGPPAAYAQELRRAAGFPAPAAVGPDARAATLRSAVERLRQHSVVRSVLAFLPELQPAWWVLRAWLALLGLDYLFGTRSFVFPLPTALGLGAVLGLPLTAAAVVVSVRLGRSAQRRPHRAPRQRLVAAGGNALLALFAVAALIGVQQRSTQRGYAATPSPFPNYGSAGALAREDGSPITNIYPYSAAGQPLTGVLLYDQDGRALDNISTTTRDGVPVERVIPSASPPPPANAYPQEQSARSDDEDPLGTPGPAAPATSPALPSPTGTPSSLGTHLPTATPRPANSAAPSTSPPARP